MKSSPKTHPLPADKRQRKLISQGSIYAWPMGIWFLIFFVAPLVIIFVYSFLKKGVHGGVEPIFTLKSYQKLVDPQYGLIVLRTLKMTIISTIITILVSLPSAYAMARSKRQTLLLFLIIIPFWTNSLIRIFAWMSILNNDGVLNQFLMKFHIIKDYVQFLYNQKVVILVSVYMYIPYAILPIFTAIDRFDFSLLEAARDLGATKFQSILFVLIPGIKSGIISALIFTFIPIFGAYTVPLLVGGKDSYMLGNIIVDQVQKTRNWPLAAAFSMIITIISVAGIIWITKSNEKDKKLNKKNTKEDNYTAEGAQK
ncbi:MAG: ABC transporter permease [Treponema sp.]|jgi:spermidine/putrescine transport system permease protein|nr:ABC transporter permease [Treponema sp.]